MFISDQEQNIVKQDSVRQLPDSSDQQVILKTDSVRLIDTVVKKIQVARPVQVFIPVVDTISVCERNAIADVTFYDPANITTRLSEDPSGQFPFIFLEKNQRLTEESRYQLLKHLREGKEITERPFHDDWIIIMIVVAIFIYTLVGVVFKKVLPDFRRFFSFRDIGDSSSRDAGALFHWESTITNFVSFINIAMFGYYASSYFGIVPESFNGLLFFVICFGVIIAAITIRHIACFLTGNISSEREAFNEYIVTIYQSYRYAALILFILIILISYTDLFTTRNLIMVGFVVISVVYLIRLIRLLLIFINRKISLLYLILYLCALEFLPVLVSVKYFTGLF